MGSHYGVNGIPYNRKLPSSKCQLCQGLSNPGLEILELKKKNKNKTLRNHVDQEFFNSFFEQLNPMS